MPEIAEVARVTHFLRQHLVGKKIAKIAAQDDSSVFGKVGTSGPAFQAALVGKRVVAAGSQGKYFWLELDVPPHPVMHLGMTGWIHIRGVQTAYNRYAERTSAADKEAWPPKYWKFHFEAEAETEGDPPVCVAFTDARRFGRIRLVDCPGAEIRSHSPLIENGPDPVVDRAIFTEAYLRGKMRGRRVPVKALLLDQAMISGVGNWVGDEILYQARLHPEQYSDDFSDAEVARLYAAICHVCDTAVGHLGDSDRFPADWLFHHRWGKGKKDAPMTLPNGERITFLQVGGRTSCVVPSRQKKTGRTAPGVEKAAPGSAVVAAADAEADVKTKTKTKKKSRFFTNGVKDEDSDEEPPPETRPAKKPKTGAPKDVKKEDDGPALADMADSKPKGGRKTNVKPTTSAPLETGRRRSARLGKIVSS